MKCPHCGAQLNPTIADSYTVIEYYYRQRARGGKLKLKQLAEQHNIDYVLFRKHKQQYDAEGRWGASKKKEVDP